MGRKDSKARMTFIQSKVGLQKKTGCLVIEVIVPQFSTYQDDAPKNVKKPKTEEINIWTNRKEVYSNQIPGDALNHGSFLVAYQVR